MTSDTIKDSIIIYAELLSNIRQISAVVTLPSPSDSTTSAQVIDNGQVLHLHHKGHTRTLILPSPVSAPSVLPLPQTPSTRLNWRLPLSPSDTTTSSCPPKFSLENQALPWTAADIRIGARISCRECQHSIVGDGVIGVWKDLPSENWAEMMEFWHCHKPHDHDGEAADQSLTQRGYGASNSISAQAGVGFVDLTSFMLSESDCNGISFSSSSLDTRFESSALALYKSNSSSFLHVFCKKCDTEIGIYSLVASSVSLFKWQILCETISPGPIPTSPQCLAATLTATISRSGSSKSVILPHNLYVKDEANKDRVLSALHLWVLNPHLVYASSQVEGKRGAMKVLYQVIDVEQGNKMLESMTSDVQDVSLPVSVIESARETLKLTSLLLPEPERCFREWKVGLLERWDSGANRE